MAVKVCRSIQESIRQGPSFDERWRGADGGLITCWETGRRLRDRDPELAQRAQNGELPVLGWKGGVSEATKSGKKYGTLHYLAKWQGLRGEDLDIDPSQEIELVCTRTGMRVIYTGDTSKYVNG